VVLDAALASGRLDVRGFLDDDPSLRGTDHHGVAILGGLETVGQPGFEDCLFIVGLGDGAARRATVAELVQRGCRFATVVHPSAVIGLGAVLGEGTVVLPMAVVHTDAHVGAHAIINTAASVDHDSVVGAFAHISPGAHLGGGVHVGEGAHVGLGASILPGVRVGDGAVVAAGAVVIDDVVAGVTVAGVPAREM
jgi:sugar O-acyltransferase (sialic acid O-acetyltransferase NeuD family)